MPEFAHPLLLALLPLAPLAAWAWLRRRGPALRWPSLRGVTALPIGKSQNARIVGAALRGLGLTALILALAGPRWPDRGTRLPVEGIAIQVLLDVSGSMAEPDFEWDGATVSRLSAAKRALSTFVNGRSHDQIGYVAFAALPDDGCPLTLSHDALLRLLAAEEPRGPTDTGTNIGDAVAWGVKQLEAAGNRRKVLVLLSDGEHNTPAPALTPRQAAQLAAHRNIPIYTIDAGPTLAADSPLDDIAARKAGAEALVAAANQTGGSSFAAHDGESLRAALETIDKLERAPVASFAYRRYSEAFPILATGALAIFAIALALESTIWRRTP